MAHKFLVTKATREKVKLKMALMAPSGSGKTTSSLLMAYGMTNNWDKIYFIDTENNSGKLKVGLRHGNTVIGSFNHIEIKPPYTPDLFVDAIQFCEEAGAEVIIIDSATHEWSGEGGCLDIHANMPGNNSYTNWEPVKKMHKRFVNAILQSNCHVICCMRSKQEYVQSSEDSGKKKIQKLGLKPDQEGTMEYEFTLVLDIAHETHMATSSKDRTQLFNDQIPFLITPKHGKMLIDWCNEGESNSKEIELQSALSSISSCLSIDELKKIYDQYPLLNNNKDFKSSLSKRKEEILLLQKENSQS